MRTALFIALVGLAATCGRADYSADLNRLLSRVQAMSHGSYTEAEWRDALSELDTMAGRARQAGDWNGFIEANVAKATIYSDVKRDYRTALAILGDVKNQCGDQRMPAMKKVYVREADTYSKLGDEASVQRVIREFEASPHYDAEVYSYSVSEGRNTPMTIMRPSADANGSISVTAMSVARRQSQYAPGNLFPDFSVVDVSGRDLNREDFRGKVLLVDLWVRDWAPWKRDLDNVRALYGRYHEKGFEILGVCIEPRADDLASFSSKNRMPWAQVADGATLSRGLGIYGEATNFLIDQNGVIIGRDLHGAELVAAVKRALRIP